MWNKLVAVLKAPVFPGDEEMTRRARALNAIHLNMGAGLVVLVTLGILFVFAEKLVTSAIFLIGILITIGGMILNRRGYVKASGVVMLATLWSMTIIMSSLSGGVRSLDIIFFISGTVIAGIVLGAKGAYSYAGLSLVSGLGLALIGMAGFEFPLLFTFPPIAAWIILFINLVFTVVPLQVAVQSLSESALRARLSEERYRLIASVMSDYAFSIQYGTDGAIVDQWLSGAFESITGYAPEEYFARGGWRSILHPEDLERDVLDMAQLRANQKVVTEVRIIRKDQSVLWVRSYGHPLWDEKHERLLGIYGAVQNITDRKQIEMDLRQRADEMALLYQITLALTSEENVYHALRVLVKELQRVMIVDAFHVGLYDEQTDLFSYSLFLNLGEDLQIPSRKLREQPGLTWEVISNRQMLYLHDITDPETQRKHNIVIVVDAGIRSYVGIPLMLHERVIGIMSVQACQVAAYTADQIRLLEMLAGQVAITVEKLNLLEQLKEELIERQKAETNLRQRESILGAVAASAELLFKSPDWRTLVNDMLERLGKSINATHAYYFENRQTVDNQIIATMFFEWTAPGFSSDLGDPRYTEVYLDEKELTLWYQNMSRGLPYVGDKKSLDTKEYDYLVVRNIKALLDVPIQIDGRWWGSIGFDDMAYAREWTNAEIDALRVAANVLTAVIKRGQLDLTLQDELQQRQKLIKELELRNAESETLRESTAIVAATLERSEAVTLILEQLARVVHYDSASVQLLIGGMLEIVSTRGLAASDTDIGLQFKLNENEPAYPVLQGTAPYILYDDVQISIPTFNDIPHNNIHAWMAIPLKVKGQIVGVIALDGHQAGQFSERDAKLAVTYANQVAVALENARLFSELQEKFAERQKLIAELENKNAELERFTYTVSHDLRSPLVTIKGFLGYLERSANAGNMESFRKDMARISSATDRMDNLLKDVLELSRIGRLVNKAVDVPFGELVKEAVEIVHGRLDARGITLQTQPNLPLVHVDKPRLIEVLQNLIDNAAKYIGAQPKPVIEIGAMGMDALGDQIFFVRDNGMGIASEYHERIFGLFDKLDAASEGTGIGLALVKRIIEFHGGRIWVESEVGQGTTFYFTLQNQLRV